MMNQILACPELKARYIQKGLELRAHYESFILDELFGIKHTSIPPNLQSTDCYTSPIEV